MVKVEIFGMAMDEQNKSPIIVLKDEQDRAIPIWIGAMEAMSISMALNNTPFPRPMTHDLLLNSIHDMGGKVTRIEVTDIEDGTFFAEIVVSTEGKTIRLDSRPSDAIALAVRAECAIYVGGSVFEKAGAPIIEDAETVIKTQDSDKWMDELNKLSEDDTKYKM
ncbi:bifunctional nuclease family protein [Pseudodesulfovibrio sp. zrk46]|uniref:bifunctional nuclease family protein n=1 Tax=Pseudodesulfovibrio sp. zrk46 TaxID=2725288 RepID=UPI001449E313|nr:bifunctional nuclease family protein [Pseudodesulfovibrio sp. zrk46]QJB57601.1 bifunctional nuclease family protein [Pseudodesulfovibrio sp. zrk46]